MKQIPGFPDYFATEAGEILSMRRGYATPKKISPYPDKDGYPAVRLRAASGRRAWRHVHRLILETFVGKRPKGKVARHLDDDKNNSTLSNLCWGTQKENMEDRESRGRSPYGERNGRARLTEKDVIKILSTAGTSAEVAAKFGVSDSCVRDIRNGRNWIRITKSGG